jgi:hypothetical protein
MFLKWEGFQIEISGYAAEEGEITYQERKFLFKNICLFK